MDRAEQVMKIMFDNGCTVRLQPGSQVGMVQVLGDHEVSIRRTMKQVIRLVSSLVRSKRPYSDKTTRLYT